MAPVPAPVRCRDKIVAAERPPPDLLGCVPDLPLEPVSAAGGGRGAGRV